MALMSESAVERMTERMAQPTKALKVGFVRACTVCIRMLPWSGETWGSERPTMPRRTGTVEMAVMRRAAPRVAKRMVRGDLAAKQRCPMSCSMRTKSSGMRNHPMLLLSERSRAWVAGVKRSSGRLGREV